MLELLLCSMVTILPDYLFRRYAQGRRFGHEITLYSVWFELRWGITACLILTVLLITLIFYYHPSTKSAVSFFRAAFAGEQRSRRGDLCKRSRQGEGGAADLQARQLEAGSSSRNPRDGGQTDAALEQAKVELEAADGKIQEAQGAYQQAVEELETKRAAAAQCVDRGATRHRKLENVVNGRAAFQSPLPTRSPSRHRSRHCCRRRRPVLKARATRPRSNSTRRWFMHTLMAWSSSSRCAKATSSIR